MPGRLSTPSDPSLKPEDWQQIWRRLKNLCLVSQRANSRLRSVTARPDEIFGDAVTFAKSSDARSVRIAAASSGPSGGNRYGCGDQCATEDMDEVWKYVPGEPDHTDIKRSWECKGVLKAVDQFLEATFYQAVEQCALCTEVGFQVVPHRLGGFRQPQTLVCDGCIDSKSPRRVVFDGKEINKLRGRP